MKRLGPLVAIPAIFHVASLGVSAGASNWNQFRGPAGSAIAGEGVRLPAVLDLEKNLSWSVEVDPGASSPVVVGSRLFVTGVREKELATFCIDRRDGRVLWRRAVQAKALEKTHSTHGPASPTPVADADRVFSSFGSFGLVAYDHQGDELWRREYAPRENTFGSASSPILCDDRLVFLRDANDDSSLEVLDPATGDELWRRERAGFRSGWSTPVLRHEEGERELLVQGAGWLTAYALEDGRERWSVPGLTDEPITTPGQADGLVFVTSYNMRTNPEVIGLPSFEELLERHDQDGDARLDEQEAAKNESVLSRPDADGEGDHPLSLFFRFLDSDRDGGIDATEWPKLVRWLDDFEFANAILAIRPPAGAEDEPEIAWQYPRGVPECPSPLVHAGRVWMVMNGGRLTCLDARSGELLIQERLEARGPYYASPVVGDGKLYLASARGELSVLDLTDPSRLLSHTDLEQRLLATPALVDEMVVVRSESRVWAFSGPE